MAHPFDPSGPVLILAPHLEYPTRNGADISLDRVGRFLSAHVPYVDLVAKDVVVRFEGAEAARRTPFENDFRAKPIAALRTVLLRSHFYHEKFLTPAYRKAAGRCLADPAYGAVLYSYITTTMLATEAPERPGRLQMIWTHNDEFKWFQDLQKTPNPFARQAARASERWLHRFFRRRRNDFLFLHVTDADREGFARYYPDHPSAIVPIGVDVAPVDVPPMPPGAEAVRLLFVGSLGVRMNHDALVHFAGTYEPYLKQHLDVPLDVDVAGSNPSPAVEALCRERGWALHADVSDEALDALFARAAFSVLPFGYATGAKLKLLHTLAHGVPFLATEKVSAQAGACVYPSLIDDAPAAWVERIEAVRARGISAEERAALLAVAHRHSWRASADRVFEAMRDAEKHFGPAAVGLH